jgi:hypothetical protein
MLTKPITILRQTAVMEKIALYLGVGIARSISDLFVHVI